MRISEKKIEQVSQALKQEGSSFAIQWKPRKKVFERARLCFNPQTMVATSYEWYALVAVINGKPVLNTYRYSVTTSKHISLMRALLQQFKINYISVDAPRGLLGIGALDDIKRAELSKWAEIEVKNKYSRAPRKFSESALKPLALLGIKVTKKDKTAALKSAEESRKVKLASEKLKRKIKAVEIVVVEREDLSSVNDALVIHPHPNRFLSSHDRREFALRALDSGFKKVIVNVVAE